MKKLLFIPLMAAVISGYSQAIVTGFSFLNINNPANNSVYAGDTARFGISYNICPSLADSIIIIESYYVDAQTPIVNSKVKMVVGDLNASQFSCKSFTWKLKTKPVQAQYTLTVSGGLNLTASVNTIPPITTDITTNILTSKVAYKWFSMQGIELEKEPENGFYILETENNGFIERKKIYKY